MRKTKNKNNARSGVPVVSARTGKQDHLVKIGELASEFRILPSTINYYTREGLLPEDARSVGGYRLYHKEKTISKLQKIEFLQIKRRLSIAEIKKQLS